MKETRILFLFLFLFLLSLLSLCTSVDTITSERSIGDGETIVSADGSFELGFFSPSDSSRRRYVGIWFKKLDPNHTVVWVANREAPLNDRLGVLNITDKGVLVLLSSRKEVVWSSNASRIIKGSPVGQLLDTGNLVVKDGSENEYLWQSFDYGGDTLLPGMKVGKNLVTGFEWSLSSWKSVDDPASGEFRYQLDLHGLPQFLVKKGNTTQYRIGSWNGIHLTGAAAMRANSIYTYMFVWNTEEVYYDTRLKNISVPTRFVITPTGLPQRFTWTGGQWVSYYRPIDQCDTYAICGSFGSCNINEYPVCSCLKGFEPVSPSKWKWSDWTDGCSRKDKLSCDPRGDGFLKLTEVKLPDTSRSWFNKSMGLQECEEKCLNNCTCVAYATLNVSSGIGCLIWFDDLIDIKQLFVGDGQDFYVRVVASELDNTETITQGKKQGVHRKKEGVILITVFSVIVVLGILLLSWILYRRKTKLKKKEMEKEMDLPIFDLSTIVSATNDFSHNNKLGEGGFGLVYKGELKEKQQIAVKRLSRTSGQGIEEFKNEVKLIAKLQHRNLVKLLGCCIQGDEKMLIYEYMPNKSLDNFIFGEARKRSDLLDWHTRLNIILGIGRGLLYLHQDSRLRIIHRDLKASNVLLDKDMNPKISDFGMARMFAGEETGGKTRRVVGTYGYMSPEYAVDGVFSVKSDVFSFGVLVLEIVSGKRNREFFHPDHSHNLLGHAWKLWMEKRPLDLVDDIDGSASSDLPTNVVRCIHVGLLCVQQQPDDRPTMSFVVLMLGSDMPLPEPKQPGYFTERYLPDAPSLARNPESSSTNEYTITLLEAR